MEKVRVLVELLSSAKHAVVHTGAGVSTAAGQRRWKHVMSRDPACRNSRFSRSTWSVDVGETGKEGGGQHEV